MSKFADWLLLELETRKMSQSDLARATGLTRQAISYYMSNKSKRPDDDSLKAIAKAFKLPVRFVFEQAGVIPPDADRDAEIDTIVEEVSDLDETDKSEVLEFVRLLADLRRKRKR